MNSKSRFGPAKFEAKCPWQNPYSHGYRDKKHKTSTAGLSRLWANGPANLGLFAHTAGPGGKVGHSGDNMKESIELFWLLARRTLRFLVDCCVQRCDGTSFAHPFLPRIV